MSDTAQNSNFEFSLEYINFLRLCLLVYRITEKYNLDDFFFESVSKAPSKYI